MIGDKYDNEIHKAIFDDKIAQLQSHSQRHFRTGVVCILLLLIAFAAGLVVLAGAHKTTASLDTNKPQNRVELFARQIANVKTKAEDQYAGYLGKMDEGDILMAVQTLELFYALSMESEEQYRELLTTYQAMIYGAASKVKGSAEWFYHHEQTINRIVSAAKHREERLQRYLSRH